MRNLFLIFYLICILPSCVNSSTKKSENSTKSVDIELKRFEIDFYTAKPENLDSVQQKYPLFFSQNLPDSVWLLKMKDSFEQNLFRETQKKFSDFSAISNQLSLLFVRVHDCFPDFETPEVITLVNKLDYLNRVLYSDHLVLISLDLYLGQQHPVYANFPSYIKQQFEAAYIVVDVAKAILQNTLNSLTPTTFLDTMIEEGKKQFLLEQFLPTLPASLKIGFTEKELEWAKTNEVFVWTYFNEQQLLKSEEKALKKRFINPAPFSQFYRVEDSQSPGRIGVWIGKRIVSSFMRQNDVSLQDLVALAPSEIFKKSKYKPTKYGN